MSKTNSIAFSSLYARLLSHWPSTIDVSQLRVYGGRRDLYRVTDLYEQAEAIEEALNGEEDVVLMIHLSDSLRSTIRAAALFCMEIQPVLLRASTVRERFEKSLREVELSPDSGWSDEDLLLIKRYFEVNKDTFQM